MHTGAVKEGQKVLLVDDLIATGGTLGTSNSFDMHISFSSSSFPNTTATIRLEEDQTIKNEELLQRNPSDLMRYGDLQVLGLI